MITYYKCKNMAGIFAGTGKLELEVDFSKIKNPNKIIALLGKNGGGKTSLMSLLNPLRGTNDARKDFVLKDKYGYEEIHLLIDNHKYVIKHFYGSSSSKNKSFITKDGEEMNENGGVRTYMAYLKEEFNLDQAYFTVARIGSNVDGFVKKSTADRKTYINEFVPNIDDYLEKSEIVNEKYKKQNNELKSLKESIKEYNHDDLISSKNVIESEYQRLSKEKEADQYQIAVFETELKKLMKEIEGIDPNIKEIYEKRKEEWLSYIFAYDEYIEKFPKLESYNEEMMKNKLSDCKYNKQKGEDDEERLNKEKEKLEILSSDLTEKILSSESTMKEIENGIIDTSGIKVQTANSKITLKEDSEEFVRISNKLDMNNLSDIENGKFILGSNKNILNNFVTNMKSLFTDDELEYCKDMNNNLNKVKNLIEENLIKIKKLNEEINNDSYEIKNIESLIKKYEKSYEIYKEMGNCENVNCPFVKDAISFMENEAPKLSDLYNNIDFMTNDKDELIKNNDKLDRILNCISECINFNKKIMNDLLPLRTITSNLNLQPYDILMDKNNLDKINEIIDDNILLYNLDIEMDQLSKIIERNEITIQNNEIKITLFNKEKEEYDKLIGNKEEISSRINELEEELSGVKRKIKLANNTLIIVGNLSDIFEKMNKYEKLYNESKEIYDKNKDNLEKIEKLNENINNLKIKNIDKLLDEKKKSLEDIKNKLYLFKVYSDKINNIETSMTELSLVKEALDPKKGIPLIFMEDYISVVEEKTNDLLDKAYNGDFQISFDIGKKDFSINVIKSDGTFLSDITLASQGELSLTTIVLSLAMIQTLLEKCKYRVVYFDEADSSLDSRNRRIYLDILQTMMDESIDQCFMITHNDEFYSQPIDLILLKDNDVNQDDTDFMKNKNILFDINKEN